MDVLDRMGNEGHPEEDYLERYIMKTCSKQEVDALDEHLLVCEHCRARLYSAEEFVSLIKMAMPLGPSRQRVPRWRETIVEFFGRPMGMAAGCAALAAVLLAAPALLRNRAPTVEIVDLASTRGAEAPSASERSLIILRLDTRGLTEPMEGQVVDGGGVPVWTQQITPEKGELRVERRLKPGMYWVRINSSQGDHENLREFPLVVK